MRGLNVDINIEQELRKHAAYTVRYSQVNGLTFSFRINPYVQ